MAGLGETRDTILNKPRSPMSAYWSLKKKFHLISILGLLKLLLCFSIMSTDNGIILVTVSLTTKMSFEFPVKIIHIFSP